MEQYSDTVDLSGASLVQPNRPFSYSAKESGSSVIFIHFYTRDSIEWRYSFYHNRAHSKILQNVAKYRSIEILFQNS